jgi:hypothetical protein
MTNTPEVGFSDVLGVKGEVEPGEKRTHITQESLSLNKMTYKSDGLKVHKSGLKLHAAMNRSISKPFRASVN